MKKIYFLGFLFFNLFVFSQNIRQNSNINNRVESNYSADEFIILIEADAIKNANLSSTRTQKDVIGIQSFDALSKNFNISSVEYCFKQDFKFPLKAKSLNLNRYVLVKLPADSDLELIMRQYQSLPEVESVEHNYTVKAHTTPNDPLYTEQWGLKNTSNAKEYGTSNLVGIPGSDINVEPAWNLHTGTTNPVTIAILDTGVDYNHPEFDGRMLPGYDFMNNDDDPMDEDFDGHGTSCAGIAAAAGNNGIGIAGVNWGADILPVKVLHNGSGSSTAVANGIIFAVDNEADVISMSLGSGFPSSVIEDAVDYAYSNNVLVFASRGNDNNAADNYPSSFNNVISVGGLSPCNTRKTPSSCDGEFWWGSSYGGGPDKMDFVAPAARITTTDITGFGGYSSNEYTDSFNGTSSACPFAAGVGALIKSYNPSLNVDEIRDIMRSTAVDIDAVGYDEETGYGKINAEAALLAAIPNDFWFTIQDINQLDICNNTDTSNINFNFFRLPTAGDEDVNMTLVNQPSGLVGSFSPSIITSEDSFILNLSGISSLTSGEYNFIIQGQSTGFNYELPVTLKVFDSITQNVNLIFPADNQNSIEIPSVFEWSNLINANSYQIQIATDSGFTNIVEDTTTSNTDYTALNLTEGNEYFWRVKPSNSCGEGTFSSIFSFITACSNTANLALNFASASELNLIIENTSASSWEIEYVLSGSAPTGTGTLFSTLVPNFNGLNSGTCYDFYVRSDCNIGFSNWNGPYQFCTSPDYCNGDLFYDSGGPDGNYSNNEFNVTTIYPSAGFNTITVDFQSFQTENCCDYMQIFDGSDTDAPFLGEFRGTNSPGSITSNNSEGALTFLFTSDFSVTRSGWEAEVTCGFISCPNPSNFIASNIAQTSADLSWDAGDVETQWEIEYGAAGFTQGSGTVVQTTANPYNLTGLNPITSYDIYLRANCGTSPGDDDSNWVGPVNFSTQDLYPPGNLTAELTDQINGTVELNWGESISVIGEWILYYDLSCSDNYFTTPIIFYSDFTFENPEFNEFGTWVLNGDQIAWTYDTNGFQYTGTVEGNYMSGTTDDDGCWYADKISSDSDSTVEFTTPEILSNGEQAENPGETFSFTFLQDNTTNNIENYNVYRDSVWIASTTEMTYTDTLPSFGNYEYYVTAVYSSGESDPSNIETVVYQDVPDISVNPTELFETLPEGGTSTQVLTITNSGEGPLNFDISSTVIDGFGHGDPVVATIADDISYVMDNSLNEEIHSPGFSKITSSFAFSTVQNVLLLQNNNSTNDYEQALINLNLPYTLVTNWGNLDNELTGGTDWDMVIINSYGSSGSSSAYTAIDSYVNNEGLLLFAHWNLGSYSSHPLLSSMGISYVQDFNTPLSFYPVNSSNTIFNIPNSIPDLVPTDDQAAIDGQIVNVISNAEQVAFFDGNSSSGAIVVNQSGNSIYNGFQSSNFQSDANSNGKQDIVELIENEINYLLDVNWLSANPTTGTVAPGSSVNIDITFDATNLIAGVYNATLDIVSNDPDESIVTVPVELTVLPPSCPEPTNFTVTNVSGNSADLSWNAGDIETQWEIEYGETGFSLGTGTIVQTASNPYILTGLNSLTAYDVYIRAICGANPGDDDSVWVGPVSFSTPADYCGGDLFYDSGGPDGNYSNNEFNVTTIYPSAGFNTITVDFLSFQTENCCDYMHIFDGEDTGAPFIGEFRGTNSPGEITSNNPTGALTFLFSTDGSVTRSGWEAEVTCGFISCPNPSNLVASNITQSSADLSWVTGDAETQWEIEYGAAGFTQGSGTMLETTANPYNLTGLNPITSYDVYLRANCGTNPGDDDSAWVGPVNFSTLDLYPPINLTAEIDQQTGEVILNWNEPNSILGEWLFNFNFDCSDFYNDTVIIFYDDFTFEIPSFGESGTWVLEGNEITWTYPGGFQYTGIVQGDYMSGTNDSGGCWFADKIMTGDSINSMEFTMPAELSNGELAMNSGETYTYIFSQNPTVNNVQSYNVYRDDVEIASTTETTYTDMLTAYGTYNYHVTAVYEEGESDPSNIATVIYQGVPDISVNPTSLEETLPEGGISTQVLTITNSGDGPLNFDISSTVIDGFGHGDPVVTSIAGDTSYIMDNSLSNEIYSPGYSQVTRSYAFSTVENILVLRDNGFTNDYEQALINLNLPYTLVTDWFSFNAGLTGGTDWDMVIVNSYGNSGNASFYTALNDYVNNDGLLLFAHWNLDSYSSHPLLSSMGISYVQDFSTPLSFYPVNSSNTIFNFPNSITDLVPTDDQAAIDGQIVNIISGAEQVAYFDGNSNSGAIVVNQNSNSIYNGFQSSNFQADANSNGKQDIVELIENEINYLLGVNWLSANPTTGTVAPGSSVNIDITFDATNLIAGVYNATLDIASNDPDEPIVTVPVELTVLPPSCPEPTNFTVTNVSGNSADLSWNAGDIETQWEIEYGETGFSLGTGTIVQTASNPYILTGLNSLTAYDVYIRAICGANPGDDDSVWVGPVSFSTPADYCGGDLFYDSGGPDGNYSNNEFDVTTIYPSAGFNTITVDFQSFQTENCCDYMQIFDGEDTNAPFIGEFRGTNSPGVITSNNSTGALTFLFFTDGSVTRSGWEASVTCEFLDGQEFDLDSLSYFPNPLSDILHVKYSNKIDKVEIYNLLGQKLRSINTNSSSVDVNMSLLSSGTYILKIHSGSTFQPIKVIKK